MKFFGMLYLIVHACCWMVCAVDAIAGGASFTIILVKCPFIAVQRAQASLPVLSRRHSINAKCSCRVHVHRFRDTPLALHRHGRAIFTPNQLQSRDEMVADIMAAACSCHQHNAPPPPPPPLLLLRVPASSLLWRVNSTSAVTVGALSPPSRSQTAFAAAARRRLHCLHQPTSSLL
jgi:hypothetical protein